MKSILQVCKIGKKQLLKQTQLRKQFNLINNIEVVEDRVFVTDAIDSLHFVKHDEKLNQLFEIADDLLPFHSTCILVLDYNTVALADKFGNISILRVPLTAEQEFSQEYVSFQNSINLNGNSGAVIKFDQIARFYNTNVITSLSLVNPQEKIQAVDIEGGVWHVQTARTYIEVNLFQNLENFMRKTEVNKNLINREQINYRSYYGSVKGVIDLDLCMRFFLLDKNTKNEFL